MLKFLKDIGYFLERFERNSPRIFWFCTLLAAFLFNFSQSQIVNEVGFQRIQPSTVIEKNTASVLAINSGGGNLNEPNNFVPLSTEVPPSNPDNLANTGPNRGNNYYPKPKYPWGVDPSYNPGGSSSALYENQIPENDEWVSNPYVWDKAQENDSSISEEEENIKQPGKLEVDFPYEYDSNGDPTLLVPNPAKARTKREYNRVEFDQTASHMHHAADLNISLPSDFDMAHYRNLNRVDRINYAKQKLSRETIINYQNEIGKSMSPLFGPKKTFPVAGFAGKFKQNTELTIQQTETPNKTILSIIREDGLHISSYSVDDRALLKLTEDNFWVLKNRNL